MEDQLTLSDAGGGVCSVQLQSENIKVNSQITAIDIYELQSTELLLSQLHNLSKKLKNVCHCCSAS